MSGSGRTVSVVYTCILATVCTLPHLSSPAIESHRMLDGLTSVLRDVVSCRADDNCARRIEGGDAMINMMLRFIG